MSNFTLGCTFNGRREPFAVPALTLAALLATGLATGTELSFVEAHTTGVAENGDTARWTVP